MWLLVLVLGCGDPQASSGEPGTVAGAKAASADVGIADHAASCGWAALHVAIWLQRDYERRFDAYLPVLAAVTDLPLPRSCEGGVSVFVAAVSPAAVTVCANIGEGSEAPRSFCACADGEVYEQPASLEPVEASTEPPPDLGPYVLELRAGFLHAIGVLDHALPVTIGADGRVVARLTAEQTHVCARRTVVELVSAELAHDAAFDAYTDDFSRIGLGDVTLASCPAWLALRLDLESETAFVVSARILGGDAVGSTYEGRKVGGPRFVGTGEPNRELLEAEGWWVGEAPPE